jgi:hypothetical protein
VPELLLAFGAIGVFLINPTPFRYNLVPLSGLLLVAGARVLPELDAQFSAPSLRATLVAIVIACHIAPFAQNVYHLSTLTNDRQRTLMNLAERMTDPAHDQVYAASGLVPTRDSIGYPWFLHTLNMRHFYDGTFPTVRGMLALRPAAVLIPSYRTDWLLIPDRMFIFQHYMPYADDFWVLGQSFLSGSGTFTCLHEGRYLVTHGRHEHVLVDGATLPKDSILTLKPGPHEIASRGKQLAFVRWIGPHLHQLPTLAQASRLLLFDGNF